jgi:hypothetical protein
MILMGDEATKPKTDAIAPGTPEGGLAQKLKPQDAQSPGQKPLDGHKRQAQDPIVARVQEEGLFGHALPDVTAEGLIKDPKDAGMAAQKTTASTTSPANVIIAEGALNTLYSLGSGIPLNDMPLVRANVSDAAISIRILKKNCTANQIVRLLGAFDSVHVLNKNSVHNAYAGFSAWGNLEKEQASIIDDAVRAISLTIKRDPDGSLAELSKSTTTAMRCYYLSCALLHDDTVKSLDKTSDAYALFVRHFASIGSTDVVKDREVRAVYLQALEKLTGDEEK